MRSRTHHSPGRRSLRALTVAALSLGLLSGTLAPASAAPVTAPTAVSLRETCKAPDFPDNKKGTAYYAAVRWAQCSGLVSGYSDGTFGMDRGVSRNETAQILFRYRGPSWTPPRASPFRDLPTANVFYPAVTWLSAQGIGQGFSDGSWRGGQDITRAQGAALLHRLTGASWKTPHLDPFADVDFGASLYEHITWVSANGIAQGYRGGTFQPARKITRAELATFLYRLHQKAGRYATQAPAGYGTPDCTRKCTMWATANVNQRTGPGLTFTSKGKLGPGAVVTKVNSNGPWIYVKSSLGRGWVIQDYLTATDPTPPPAPKPPAPRPPQPTQYPLAVYGTLRHGQSAYHLLQGRTTAETDVRVDGFGLWLRPESTWWSFMVPSTSKDSVLVERMTIRSSQYRTTLQEVDEWERFDPSKPLSSQNYNRKLVTDRQGKKSWAYVAGSQMASYVKSQGTKIVGGDYLKRF